MAALTRKEVEEVALLARLYLDVDELARMETELGAILGHVAALADVDTTDVPPMTHAVPMDLRLREDYIGASLSAEDALAAAPRKDGDLIVVPAILPSGSEG